MSQRNEKSDHSRLSKSISLPQMFWPAVFFASLLASMALAFWRPIELSRTYMLGITLMTGITAAYFGGLRDWRNPRKTSMVWSLLLTYPLGHFGYALNEWGVVDSRDLGSYLELAACTGALVFVLATVDLYEKVSGLRGVAVDLMVTYFGFILPLTLLLLPDIEVAIEKSGHTGLIAAINMSTLLASIPLALAAMAFRVADMRTHILDGMLSICISVFFLLNFLIIAYPASPMIEWWNRIGYVGYAWSAIIAVAVVANPPRLAPTKVVKRSGYNGLLVVGSAIVVIGLPLSVILGYLFDRTPGLIPTVIASTIATSLLVIRIVLLLLNEVQEHRASRRDALTDDLTGLLNRRGLLKWLDSQPVEKYSLAFIDIDDFKATNDFLGHQGGDKVLTMVADILRRENCAAAARLGGDEFVVAYEQGEEPLTQVGLQLRTRLCGWRKIGQQNIYVTATVGISGFGHRSSESILRAADLAMYHAKHERLGYAHSASLDHHQLSSRLHRRQQVVRALDVDSIPVHLQPVYDMAGELAGFEALSRLFDVETGQMLTPEKFLPTVKSDGLEHQLTQLLISGLGNIHSSVARYTISINVSPSWLALKENAETLHRWLIRAGRKPHKTIIEIIEDEDRTDGLHDAIYYLRAIGYQIALDDFGTGYTSLSRLGDFKIDHIKIDRAIIDAAATGSNAALQSAIQFAHKMGASVVAEGVATPAHLMAVQMYQVDYVQGFLFSRPVPVSEAHLVPQRFSMSLRPQSSSFGHASVS
ncbi:MAG: bifunctional diguanylate cyclase/phosphodiesterase [Gammaproteobacteria bacterium]|nr:bifunctional diguanylate cyclase/phosphodiesterase [Gammaproteobacteria bacterium]